MSIPDIELAELVLRAARRLRRANAAELAGLPVNPHQARALRVIARLEPVRMADLAERLHVVARSATDVVEFLVAGGWVERSPDPGDRRVRLLSLTDAGRGLLVEVEAARARAATATLGALPPQARAELSDALGLVAGTRPAGPPGGGDDRPAPAGSPGPSQPVPD